MTEFNPLLGKLKIQHSTDSSEQEDDISKPLLRKKDLNTVVQVRYRPQSMSMIARANYAKSGGSSLMTSSTESQQVMLNRETRPKSLIETSSHSMYVTKTNAEKLFVKSLSVTRTQKITKSSSSATIESDSAQQFIRPITSSEPLYIQDIPNDPFPNASIHKNQIKVEIKEQPSPRIQDSRTHSPRSHSPLLITETSKIEIDGSLMPAEAATTEVVEQAPYFSEQEENNVSSDSSETESDSELDSKEDDLIPSSDSTATNVHQEILYPSITPGKESSIEVKKENGGLGINIIGGVDTLLGAIHILNISGDQGAFRDGRLWPGDMIVSVNGKNLRLATLEEATEAIQDSPATVRLVILRDPEKSRTFLRYQRKMKLPFLSYWDAINNETESDLYDLYDVHLKKNLNQNLGLCIIGRRNDPGVFIAEVTPGSVAEKARGIRRGDQIIAINGMDVTMLGQESAAYLVKNTHGNIHLKMGRLKTGIPDDLMDMPASESNRNVLEDKSLSAISRELTRFVEIEKPYNSALGIYIAGGVGSPLGDVPVFVALIEKTNFVGNKLKVGDIIVSVNGQATEKKTHDEVVEMMNAVEDLIILMQVQEPTSEIQKLISYLDKVVNRRKQEMDLEIEEAPKQPKSMVGLKPTAMETTVY